MGSSEKLDVFNPTGNAKEASEKVSPPHSILAGIR